MTSLRLVVLLFLASTAQGYDREEFSFKTYKGDAVSGFYTGYRCSAKHIDHVVSLKDAYDSGAKSWTLEKKAQFANDKSNHVVACGSINSSKGNSGPSDFFRKSSDGKGVDYTFVDFCAYVKIYYKVKVKYGLEFSNNDSPTFRRCGFTI